MTKRTANYEAEETGIRVEKTRRNSPITTADDLFDNWFDPIETEVRSRAREFIEELIRGELDAMGVAGCVTVIFAPVGYWPPRFKGEVTDRVFGAEAATTLR